MKILRGSIPDLEVLILSAVDYGPSFGFQESYTPRGGIDTSRGDYNQADCPYCSRVSFTKWSGEPINARCWSKYS
jgi:hypothetical protein